MDKADVLNRYLNFCTKERAKKIKDVWENGMYPSFYIYCLIKVKQL